MRTWWEDVRLYEFPGAPRQKINRESTRIYAAAVVRLLQQTQQRSTHLVSRTGRCRRAQPTQRPSSQSLAPPYGVPGPAYCGSRRVPRWMCDGHNLYSPVAQATQHQPTFCEPHHHSSLGCMVTQRARRPAACDGLSSGHAGGVRWDQAELMLPLNDVGWAIWHRDAAQLACKGA